MRFGHRGLDRGAVDRSSLPNRLQQGIWFAPKIPSFVKKAPLSSLFYITSTADLRMSSFLNYIGYLGRELARPKGKH